MDETHRYLGEFIIHEPYIRAHKLEEFRGLKGTYLVVVKEISPLLAICIFIAKVFDVVRYMGNFIPGNGKLKWLL